MPIYLFLAGMITLIVGIIGMMMRSESKRGSLVICALGAVMMIVAANGAPTVMTHLINN